MAERELSALRARLAHMCEFPEGGAPRFHLRPGVRAVIERRRVAYPLAGPEALVVLRGLDAAQDVEGLAARGGLG